MHKNTHMHSHCRAPSTIAFHSITYVNCLRSSFLWGNGAVPCDGRSLSCALLGEKAPKSRASWELRGWWKCVRILYFQKIWLNCNYWGQAKYTTRNLDTIQSNKLMFMLNRHWTLSWAAVSTTSFHSDSWWRLASFKEALLRPILDLINRFQQ